MDRVTMITHWISPKAVGVCISGAGISTNIETPHSTSIKTSPHLLCGPDISERIKRISSSWWFLLLPEKTFLHIIESFWFFSLIPSTSDQDEPDNQAEKWLQWNHCKRYMIGGASMSFYYMLNNCCCNFCLHKSFRGYRVCIAWPVHSPHQNDQSNHAQSCTRVFRKTSKSSQALPAQLLIHHTYINTSSILYNVIFHLMVCEHCF